MRGRRSGSVKTAYFIAIGLCLLALADFIYLLTHLNDMELYHSKGAGWKFLINSASSFMFGATLFWWAVSPTRAGAPYQFWSPWRGLAQSGIGNETVVMVVSVVSAVVVIFTLTDAMFKSPACP